MEKKEIVFFDKNITRKSTIVKNSLQYFNGTKIPLPSVVEISDSGTCNRTCSFCPRSDPEYPDKKEFISDKLHNKIFLELSSLNYSGMIIYSGFNEPLLNKKAFENIASARNYLPNAKIELITNGDVLSIHRLKKLFESGLNTILISVYDGPDDMIKFEEMCKKAELDKKQYVIRNRYLPPDQDFGITINNRSGNLLNSEYKIETPKKYLNRSCYYPGYMFFIDYNGDVLMCSHDWGKKNILGNLYKESIQDIWLSKKTNIAREKLFKGSRTFKPCNKCDVSGELIGENHHKQWSDLFKNKIFDVD